MKLDEGKVPLVFPVKERQEIESFAFVESRNDV